MLPRHSKLLGRGRMNVLFVICFSTLTMFVRRILFGYDTLGLHFTSSVYDKYRDRKIKCISLFFTGF